MRTAVDSNVLIAAFRGDSAAHDAAVAILDDPDREFLSSAYVRLEVLPKTLFYGNEDERSFYEAFFEVATQIPISEERFHAAYAHAAQYNLSAGDAIVTEAAIHAGAEEFVTAEKKSKPMFSIPENVIRMTSINPD